MYVFFFIHTKRQQCVQQIYSYISIWKTDEYFESSQFSSGLSHHDLPNPTSPPLPPFPKKVAINIAFLSIFYEF